MTTQYPDYLIFTPRFGNRTPMLYTRMVYGDAVVSRMDLDATDAKGRKLGFIMTKRPFEYVAPTEEQVVNTHGLVEMDRGYGSFFRASVQLSKDGRAFGASQREHIFKTEAEADAFIADTVAKRRKVYEK